MAISPTVSVLQNRSKAAGFTLLEVLAALAVFALMGVMVAVGLRYLVDARSLQDNVADDVAVVQLAYIILQRDIGQAVMRPVRTEAGVFASAFWGESFFNEQTRWREYFSGAELMFALTRMGHSDPLSRQPQSSLQRVAYFYRDETIYRITWPTLDRAPRTDYIAQSLLTNVENLKVTYIDGEGRRHTNWFTQTPDGTDLHPRTGQLGYPFLPAAVEIRFDLPLWGAVEWFYPLPEGSNGKY